MRLLLLALLLALPSAAAGGSLDLRPVAGYWGVLLPGETRDASDDLAQQALAIEACGGDQVTDWRVTVTIVGLAPGERVVAHGIGTGDTVTLTHDAPEGKVASTSPTSCMAGVILDGTALAKPVAWSVQA